MHRRTAVGRLALVAVVTTIVLTAFATIEVGKLYSSSSQTAATSQSSAVVGEMIFIHVINSSSGEPISNEPLTAGPASSLTDVAYTPGGPFIKECGHEVPSGATVVGNDTVIFNSTTTTFTPCPLRNYITNATGWVIISNQNATYFFIKVGNLMISNYDVIVLGRNQTYVTAPFPQGNFTVSTTHWSI